MDVINQQSSRSRLSSESVSVEMERDGYKEKIEHFKLLIRQLQQEIQSHKVRKEGAETVSRLLQESKQEAVHLQMKVRTLETVLRNLQNRLEKHGLSSEITLQEGETYIPGQSKQLLDNLTRENTRLRGIIRKSSGDPEEMSRLQQGYQHNQQNVAELEALKVKLQNRVSELENVLKASDNDKDTQIGDLQERLNGVQLEFSTRDRLCTSLAEEATNLKKQLNDVAHKCQELAQRLVDRPDPVSQPRKEVAEKQMSATYKEENMTLKSENQQLKVNVTKVTEMNKRWQDYNQQRETHVRALQTEIAELKTKVAAPPGDSMMRDMNEQVMRILDEAKGSVLKANQERDKVKREFDQVKRELEQKKEMAVQLSHQVQQLNAHLTQTGRQTSKDDSETMAALKTQIQICTEDFESERRDREKSQEKVLKYEEEIKQLRSQVETLRRQPHAPPPTTQPQPYIEPFYHYQLPGPHGNLSGEGLAARGIARPPQRNIDRYNVIDGGLRHTATTQLTDDVTEDGEETHVIEITRPPPQVNDDTCSSLRASSLSSDSDKNSSASRNSPNILRSRGSSPMQVTRTSCDILKCPKCSKEYTSDQHGELLEHIEICCE